MEKQRIKSVTKPCRRLLNLALIVFAAAQLSAQNFSQKSGSQLIISPSENQDLFTKQDIKFEVTLPDVRATQVQLKTPEDQPNVLFKTFRKYDEYETGSTKLELWLSFEKKGEYRLQPLSIIVKNKRQNIRFERITIKENPANLIPRIVVTFDDGHVIYSDEPVTEKNRFSFITGRKQSFTISLQYAVQLIQFNWELPTESILHQTKTYEITEVKYREKTYSEELIPVATFDWTVLQQGLKSIPKFRLTTTGYNGHKYDITTPDFLIDFKPSSEESGVPENWAASTEEAFDDAFVLTSDGNETVKTEITVEHCKTLAALRQSERNSLLNHRKILQERKTFESYIGLPSSENETIALKFIISTVIASVMLIALVIVCIKKKIIGIITFSILSITAIVFSISSYVQKSQLYAICIGTQVNSIPNEKASSNQLISAGTRVKITEHADEWYYVEVGSTGGWCKSENLIIIK